MYQKKMQPDIRCPLEYGLKLFGGKWKSRIICILNEKGTLRYSSIRKEMLNITDAVLAATLKELINDELVTRKQYDEIPPRVEYSLTDKGKSVVPILQNICKWAGLFQRESSDNIMTQCQKCDYNR
ncbi:MULTISPECIES: winged helix-turn-helix transcriptional regulator [Gemella]|uniref:winged helix-turn-helix transcriptional regulator n=1 Tax=Gemella TaxID=1378 RepID=UPI00076837CA|nr:MULTISPECIES: helix-turn-helix domain-containing protein [Gemella]AME09178.1 HxlR family transcriptional regulator [Gemella sp. oral taxon 928]